MGLSILALRMSTSESSQMKDFFLKHAVSCHDMPSLYLMKGLALAIRTGTLYMKHIGHLDIVPTYTNTKIHNT